MTHTHLLQLANHYSTKMEAVHDKTGLSKRRWQYLFNKYSLVCDLIADLGEVRFRRVGR